MNNQYWENQQDAFNFSKSRGGVFPGAYNQFGPLTQIAQDKITRFMDSPSYDTWEDIMLLQILPSMTLLNAMMIDFSFPSETQMIENETYPSPEALKNAVAVVIAQREIEIQANIKGLSAQSGMTLSI